MFKKSSGLPQCWLTHLDTEFDQPAMRQLSEFLETEKDNGHRVYPENDRIFEALKVTPLHSVRAVILGQDPYHGANQAHGLSFSVPVDQRVPPSLRNIYKELVSDLNCVMPDSGHLMPWARQGVLLLNSVLTVRESCPGSHQGKGWEPFTDAVIEVINSQRQNVVFLLWGAYAQKKGKGIDSSKHLVLQAAHPSPLSAYRGFLGCKHFSQANDYLQSVGEKPIDWQIGSQASLLLRD